MTLAIGIVFETFDSYPRRPGDPDDAQAEYEPESTLRLLERSIEVLGHEPLRLGAPAELLESIGRGALPRLDAALNIAEGYGSRNREAWAPALLEMAGLPCLGSDGLTLSLCLDKAWAKERVGAAGVPVLPHSVFDSPAALHVASLPGPYPLFVKPTWEGTSKGIRASSRVEGAEALAREVERVSRDYAQPAFVEPFLSGAEYTVTVVGNGPARALPVLQRALEASTRIGLHALEPHAESAGALAHVLPGKLAPDLEEALQAHALRAYAALECLDFARADFRLDAEGRPFFLEMNPLPSFAVEGSFGILAELQGRAPEELVGEVLHAGLRRLRILGGSEP